MTEATARHIFALHKALLPVIFLLGFFSIRLRTLVEIRF